MLERDPLNVMGLQLLAENYFNAHRDQQAIQMWRQVIELNPAHPGCQACLSMAMAFLGRAQEALSLIASERDEFAKLCDEPVIYWMVGQRAASNAALETLKRKYGGEAGGCLVHAYAARGDLDAAFDWLDRAYEKRDSGLIDVKTDRFLINLHKDPRFRAFLVKMKLDGDRPPLGR
jgi:predicted Zn-dependent protease